MLAKNCLKVSLKSRLSRKSYDAKFGMDECVRNHYGVTLSNMQVIMIQIITDTNTDTDKLVLSKFKRNSCVYD